MLGRHYLCVEIYAVHYLCFETFELYECFLWKLVWTLVHLWLSLAIDHNYSIGLGYTQSFYRKKLGQKKKDRSWS